MSELTSRVKGPKKEETFIRQETQNLAIRRSIALMLIEIIFWGVYIADMFYVSKLDEFIKEGQT